MPGNSTRGAYPDGAPGIRMSLDAMAQKMREGRVDPKIRGWAIRALRDAGIDGRSGDSVRAQASAILDAFRAVTTYAPDPYGVEYIPSAAATLCLAPNLCVSGEDCDGLSVALGSLMLSIGIPTQIVKQSFGADAQEHVLIAVHDGSDWLYADPSTNLPLGSAVNAVNEVWIDPLGAVGPLPDAQPEIITLGKPHGLGSVFGYPTDTDVQHLLQAATYNQQQLTAAAQACIAGFPDAQAWIVWKNDLASVSGDLQTFTDAYNINIAPAIGTWLAEWEWEPVAWDQLRAIIDRQIDLDTRFAASGTTCTRPDYSNEPQPVASDDPDQWIYQDANSAIKQVETVAKDVTHPAVMAGVGVIAGAALALAGIIAWNTLASRVAPRR